MKKKFSLIELYCCGHYRNPCIPFGTNSKCHEKSRAAVCKSNLNQLGIFAVMYARDNDGVYIIQLNGGWYVDPQVHLAMFQISKQVFTVHLAFGQLE